MIHIEFSNNPKEEDIKVLTNGISENALKKRGIHLNVNPFGFFHRNTDGSPLAGINGVIFYNSMYIDQLFVSPSIQHQGIGSLLMKKALQYAFESSCNQILVTTMDFEALEFYQKFGFALEFQRDGYPQHSKMIYLKKVLF
jgi:GNAT superfamily N-acetyltransferase